MGDVPIVSSGKGSRWQFMIVTFQHESMNHVEVESIWLDMATGAQLTDEIQSMLSSPFRDRPAEFLRHRRMKST